jgi:hypothetical protein
MDTYAQRTILNARALLVDGLAPGLVFGDTAGDRLELAARIGHGLTDEQAWLLVDLASALHRLVLDDPAPPECQNCAEPLVQAPLGRPRRFCSDACRQQHAHHAE